MHGDDKKDIFGLSKKILDSSKNLPYKIDGLIYTPNSIPFVKGTWTNLLKWKDKTLNSVDFLIKYDKIIKNNTSSK